MDSEERERERGDKEAPHETQGKNKGDMRKNER